MQQLRGKSRVSATHLLNYVSYLLLFSMFLEVLKQSIVKVDRKYFRANNNTSVEADLPGRKNADVGAKSRK